jgi:outer membrane lipoprotein SlyB
VRPTNDLVGGNVLPFTLFGTPGGKAQITIAGARGVFFLPEVRSGEYAAAYTIKRSDRIATNSTVTANLRVGDRVTTTTLQKPLMLAAAPAPVQRICGNCGTIEAVNVVETQGDGNYLGTIGGGVVGGLLGNQVGGGNGKTLATLAGVVGGALAGRAVEGNVKKSQHYEVVVRLQNGGAQTISLPSDQGFHTGDRVRINDGVMTKEM